MGYKDRLELARAGDAGLPPDAFDSNPVDKPDGRSDSIL
jgi:hypothetical protein